MTSASASPRAAAQSASSPAERRKRKMRDVIVNAAESVFAEEGASGLSMRRLAERIDYSPAAIYKYFRSKCDLVREIREMFFERLLARLAATRDPQDWSTAGMKRCMCCYIETGLEQPNHYRMAFAIDPDVEDVATEGTKAYEASTYLENLIETGIKADAFHEMDPKIAAKSVWAALHGLTLLMVEMDDFPHALPGSEHVTREALIDFHVELIARGMARA